MPANNVSTSSSPRKSVNHPQGPAGVTTSSASKLRQLLNETSADEEEDVNGTQLNSASVFDENSHPANIETCTKSKRNYSSLLIPDSMITEEMKKLKQFEGEIEKLKGLSSHEFTNALLSLSSQLKLSESSLLTPVLQRFHRLAQNYSHRRAICDQKLQLKVTAIRNESLGRMQQVLDYAESDQAETVVSLLHQRKEKFKQNSLGQEEKPMLSEKEKSLALMMNRKRSLPAIYNPSNVPDQSTRITGLMSSTRAAHLLNVRFPQRRQSVATISIDLTGRTSNLPITNLSTISPEERDLLVIRKGTGSTGSGDPSDPVVLS